MVSFVSNARDRNHLNLCQRVFPLLKVVDPAVRDVFKGSIIELVVCDNTRQDLSWASLQLRTFPPLGSSENY